MLAGPREDRKWSLDDKIFIAEGHKRCLLWASSERYWASPQPIHVDALAKCTLAANHNVKSQKPITGAGQNQRNSNRKPQSSMCCSQF